MTALPHADAPAPSPRERALAGNLAAAGSLVVWAAGFPAAGVLLARWEPLTVAAGRFAMALGLLVPLMLILEGWPKDLPWGRALWVGAVGIGGAGLLVILALAVTDPVTAAVFATASPLTGTLVECVRDGRRLSRSFLLGLVASVAGGVIATLDTGLGGGSLALGALLSVGSCLAYAWGSDASVRYLPGQSALAQGTATVTGGAVAALAALGLWVLWGGAGWPAGGAGWGDLGLFAVYGLGAMALTQVLFLVAVKQVGVAVASFHMNIAPFYVMVMMLALGGEWSWVQAVGAAVVAVGVVLAQR